MTALFKFLVLLAIFLSASLGDAFLHHARLNHLIRFEELISKPTNEPSSKLIGKVNGISTFYRFEAVNGVNAKQFEAVNGINTSYTYEAVNGVNANQLWECVTAGCKAFSLANGKGTGTNDRVIRSLDD
jgi:hypothetical protein